MNETRAFIQKISPLQIMYACKKPLSRKNMPIKLRTQRYTSRLVARAFEILSIKTRYFVNMSGFHRAYVDGPSGKPVKINVSLQVRINCLFQPLLDFTLIRNHAYIHLITRAVRFWLFKLFDQKFEFLNLILTFKNPKVKSFRIGLYYHWFLRLRSLGSHSFIVFQVYRFEIAQIFP